MTLTIYPITGEFLQNGELPFHWGRDSSGGYIKVYDSKYDGLSVLTVPNAPFYAKLRIDHMAATCSGSAYVVLKNVDTDAEYTIYSKEFNQILDRFIDDGVLEGHWIYINKASRHTLAGA